jgi:hypothetical protein
MSSYVLEPVSGPRLLTCTLFESDAAIKRLEVSAPFIAAMRQRRDARRLKAVPVPGACQEPIVWCSHPTNRSFTIMEAPALRTVCRSVSALGRNVARHAISGRFSERNCTSADLPMAPSCCATTSPFFSNTRVGSPDIPNFIKNLGFCSVSSLKIFTLPEYSVAAQSISGAMSLHGPHHSA